MRGYSKIVLFAVLVSVFTFGLTTIVFAGKEPPTDSGYHYVGPKLPGIISAVLDLGDSLNLYDGTLQINVAVETGGVILTTQFVINSTPGTSYNDDFLAAKMDQMNEEEIIDYRLPGEVTSGLGLDQDWVGVRTVVNYYVFSNDMFIADVIFYPAVLQPN